METIKKEVRLCLSCMEEHEVSTVQVREHNTIKGREVSYIAVYDYCDRADELTASEEMVKMNDKAFKAAYHRLIGGQAP